MASGKGAGAQPVELFEAADKVEEDEDDEAEETRCVEAIKEMKEVPVTTTLLMDTQVGKQLRQLTEHRSTESTVKKIPAEESLKSPGLSRHHLKSPSSNVKDENSMKTEVTVQVKTSVTTTTSKPSQEPPKIGNIAKTGDTRDRMRELLAEAFVKVLTEAEDEFLDKAKSRNIAHVAATIESAMFKKLGLSSGAANEHEYRSLMFNLKDPENPDFRRRVFIGEIDAEELLTMSVEDMASDERKRANEDIKKKALFECELGLKAAVSTDKFKCGKCKQRMCTYFQMQTRSADEPMTTFVTCVNCNYHWKFC